MLTNGRAAQLLGSSRQHVVDLCERGEISFTWAGHHRRIARSELDRVLRRTFTREQERSLWLHRAVAGRLVMDPDATLAKARANIDKLLVVHRGTRAGEYVRRWQTLLQGGTDGILDALTSFSPEAAELRQNSPFAGALSEDERRACHAAFRKHWRDEHAA